MKIEHFKYAHFFVKDPQPIVELARETATWDPDKGKKENGKRLKQAKAILTSMGLHTSYHEAVLKGYADIEADENGWLMYIDHRTSDTVMDRLIGEEGFKKVHYRQRPCVYNFNPNKDLNTDDPEQVTCFRCRSYLKRQVMARITGK